MAIVRFLLAVLLFLSGLTGAGMSRAQESGTVPPATSPVIPTVNVPAASVPQPGKPEVLLRTESGELIPYRELLGDQVIDELLQRGLEQRSVPRYTLAQQELSAAIDRDEITINLELQIQVHPVDEWVTIPMSFGDVFVKRFDHRSDAMKTEAVPEFGEQNARRLHLFGAGLHTISLEMMGKARSLAPGVRQLNLNLASATASHADIKFAGPVELQSLPVGSVDRPTRDEKGVRSVEFWGLAQAFSLSWSDVVQRIAQKPVIQVLNRMKLDLTTIPVNLTGTQQLQISGSPINEVRVTFPDGFQLQEVDARNASGISVLNNFERTSTSGPETALVRLTTATEGALTLSFDLELANRTFPQDIRVALPAIQDANVQSGDLDILFPTGLLVQQTVVEGAQRKRVTSDTDLSVAATAFRMRSTESHVVLHVEETESQFAVSPEITLQPDTQNVILTARYPINVLTGSLLDLAIYWPGYSSGEWQILPGTTRLISGKTIVPLSPQQSDSETDVLQLTFRERQSGEFIVEFRAYAPLAAVRSGAIQLRCPEIQARLGQPFVLITIESDEFSIRPISMGTGEPLPTVPLPAPAATVAVESGLQSESWLHDDASIPIRLELPAQAPSVRANVRLGMQPRGSRIEVLETIGFEIEHRDLAGLALTVPAGVEPTVRISGQSEILRATEVIDSDSETHWSFRLPEARRGSLTFEVNYHWTPTGTTDPLPLILPAAAEVLSIEVGTGSGSGLTVQDAANWQPVYSEKFDAAWKTSQPVTTVPLRWQKGLALTSIDSPDLILAGTQILGNQTLTTTLAIYERLPGTIIVETPLDVGLPAILVDQQSMISQEAQQQGNVQWEKIVERGIIRWTVRTLATRPATSGRSGPHVVECSIRDRIPQQSSLWMTATLKRATIVGESPAVPVVWYTGSQEEFQTASASPDFISLTQHPATFLPWGESARLIADRQLKAILSPYPTEMQLAATETLDNWISASDHHDLFFGSAKYGALRLNLIPFVSLLLVSAVVCVIFFVVLSILRRITIIVPLLLIGCGALVAWLFVPEWTSLLAPFVAMGVVCGAVSVTFQRLISDRRMRFPKASQVGEYPTVFGYSGMLSHVIAEQPEPAVSPSGTRSEFNVSSFTH